MRITLHGTPKTITPGSFYAITDGRINWLITSGWHFEGEGRWDVAISSVSLDSHGFTTIHCTLLDCHEQPQEGQDGPFTAEMNTGYPI